MSQSRQRGSGGSGSRSSSSSPATGSTRPRTRPTGSRPAPVRQPLNQQRGSRPTGGRVDQALPPFSARRYIVIWAGFVVVLVAVIIALLLLNNKGNNAASSSSSCIPANAASGKYMVIETAKGCIAAKLHTEPDANVSKTIANFEQKANSGYFNGLVFHRVEDWVIQGGDPTGTGRGGSRIPSEYNHLPYNASAPCGERGR